MLDEHARHRGAEVRFRGWSEPGMFWGDDALLYESARSGRLRLYRGARGWRFAGDGEMQQEHASANAPGDEAPSRLRRPPGWIDFTARRQGCSPGSSGASASWRSWRSGSWVLAMPRGSWLPVAPGCVRPMPIPILLTRADIEREFRCRVAWFRSTETAELDVALVDTLDDRTVPDEGPGERAADRHRARVAPARRPSRRRTSSCLETSRKHIAHAKDPRWRRSKRRGAGYRWEAGGDGERA